MPKNRQNTYSNDNNLKWADSSKPFGFPKILLQFGLFQIYRKYDLQQCLLMVNNHYIIQKSCLEQQGYRPTILKHKNSAPLLCDFCYCYFKNYCIRHMITDITCFKVVYAASIWFHTALWYNHISNMTRNHKFCW